MPDDIDHTHQLDYLAWDLGWFGKPSRMHDLIHDMGKYVVNMQKILNVAVWRIEDLEEVMIHNMVSRHNAILFNSKLFNNPKVYKTHFNDPFL